MSEPRRHSRIGRPYRRARRWARHTPNGDIALAMMAVGAALVFAAIVAGFVLL